MKGSYYPEKYIVLSAHYDHLGKRGRKVYNGADDNASGVAALLVYAKEIAEMPLKHSVIFLLTDGEEVDLLGAKAFVKKQEAILKQVVVNINIDMIAGNSRTKKLHYIHKRLDKVFDAENYARFKAFSSSTFPITMKYGFKSTVASGMKRINWMNASDHSAFYHKKIPVVYFGVGTHKNYHTPNDTFERANLNFFYQASQVILKYIEFIDVHS